MRICAVTHNYALKLASMVAEMARHRASIEEFRRYGYIAMRERHERLLTLVCEQIRLHCREHGLELPPECPPEEPDYGFPNAGSGQMRPVAGHEGLPSSIREFQSPSAISTSGSTRWP